MAREIAAVVRAHEAEGRAHDLVLLGNDAADSGDFQVGIRLAYELGRPVVAGIATVEVADGVAMARGEGPNGQETFELPLPAVVTVLEGGVEPRYPDGVGADEGQEGRHRAAPADDRAGRPEAGPAQRAARRRRARCRSSARARLRRPPSTSSWSAWG